MKTLKEILARKAEIRSLLEGDQEVDLQALETELRELTQKEKELRDQAETAEKRKKLLEEAREINNGQAPESRTVETFNTKVEERNEDIEASEKRGKALKENRSVTVGSSNIVLPKVSSNTINPSFNEVSTLIDRVTSKPLMGGESYSQPYLKGYGTGDYTDEGADYVDAEPTFDYADINKTKITAYAEDTEELQKLPAANYDTVVMNGITVATRKKLTREILIGDGTTGHLVGIFSANAKAIDVSTDLSLSDVDATTLDEIIYSYGGDEDVEDAAVLILNKKDLKKFAQLRDANGKKIYTVVSQGNSGTIDGVPFIINSACYALSDSATSDNAYCMAYGPLSNYLLTIFSDLDVQRSTDYKFKQGMIAHRGSGFFGGNVVSNNGFLRVKKAPTA